VYIADKLSTLLLKCLFVSLLIVTTLANVSAQSSSEAVSLTERERSWVAEHPTITAVNNTAYAPFDYISAGEPAGLSIDYLNLITSKVGLKVQYVNYGSWFENLKMGMEQKIDILPALSKTEDRQEYFTFSDPYIIDDLVFWGRVGSERINNLKDLKDKRIGIIEGDSIFTFYKKHYPELNYVVFTTNMGALNALISNVIDVYPHETFPIEFSITQNSMQDIEVIGDEFFMKNSEIDQRIASKKQSDFNEYY
jgi:polar amino acid transport system substrate-binding protein